MSEDITLKSCPFCGRNVNYACNIECVPHGVYCNACKYVMSYSNIKKLKLHEPFAVAMEQIAEHWNRRISDDS